MNRQYHYQKELKHYILFFVLAFIGFGFIKYISSGKNISYMGVMKKYDGSIIHVVEAKAEAASVTETPANEPSAIAGDEREFKDKYQELAFKVFGEKDGPIAYAIARAESSLKPHVCHIDEKEYSCGLMQINLRAHFDKVPGETFEEKAEWLKDPENNFTMGKVIKANARGWTPWTMYTNKVYEQFLD